MLDQKIAQDVIFQGLSLGADFCDIFIEKNFVDSIAINSSKVKDIKSGVDFGIGIRLIFGTQSLYGYTNSARKEDLLELTKTLGAQYNKKIDNIPSLSFKTFNPTLINAVSNLEKPTEYKVSKLLELNDLTRKQSNLIEQVNINLLQRRQEVEVFDSEGLHMNDIRPYCRISSSAIAKDGTEQASGSWNPGVRGGYQFVEDLDFNWIADYTAKKAVTVLKAKPCPAGKMPVVIDNGFGGVIFHEACGHSLETTAVEKKASVFWDKKGEMIAHEALSAVDDGTIDNLWGSLSCDDEGMQTQKTQLIKNGKLENFLCDRLGHIKTGHPRTGSARRESNESNLNMWWSINDLRSYKVQSEDIEAGDCSTIIIDIRTDYGDDANYSEFPAAHIITLDPLI